VRLLVLIYVVRGFSMVVLWIFQNLNVVDGCGMDGWFSLGINDYFTCCLGL
jgi:hypothetical protein